jgi:mannose-6-phosphate isomerase-like protein (cupin superfamily)
MTDAANTNLILRNTFNGETFIFSNTPDEDDVARFDVVLEPGGSGGGDALVHVHPVGSETFKVRTGCLAIVMDGKEQLVGAGRSITVPPGTPHSFKNAGAIPVKFTAEFSPAQQQRNFYMNFGSLAQHRREWFSARGEPNLLLIALTFNTYRDHLYLAGIPIRLQKILFALLAPVARLRGYRLEVLPDGVHPDGVNP